MANFLASLRSSATVIETLQRSLTTAQNNVSNASTPGYARQHMRIASLEFDPEAGLSGGIATAGLASARDRFAEAAVGIQVSRFAGAAQNAKQLEWVESALDMNDSAGGASALDRMYKTFVSWSLAPNSVSEKQNVIAAAGDLAVSLNRTAESLMHQAQEAKEQIGSTLSAIDSIAERIRIHNSERRQGRSADAGIDARLHSDLEQLAELVDVQALWQEDGSVTVLAGGQAALVVGDRRYSVSAVFAHTDPAPVNPDAITPVQLLDNTGTDVSAHLKGGKLGALVEFRNGTLPYYLGSASTEGELNRLAKTIADRVNDILAAGYPPPGAPFDLFIYGASAVAIAHTIQLNGALIPAVLESTDKTAVPPRVNGVPLDLASLARPSQDADRISGESYVGFFGKLAADAGRRLSNAQQERDSREQLTAQARNFREQLSGVSLDEEAIRLVEFQRAYQASARMVTTLNELTEMAVNLGRV